MKKLGTYNKFELAVHLILTPDSIRTQTADSQVPRKNKTLCSRTMTGTNEYTRSKMAIRHTMLTAKAKTVRVKSLGLGRYYRIGR